MVKILIPDEIVGYHINEYLSTLSLNKEEEYLFITGERKDIKDALNDIYKFIRYNKIKVITNDDDFGCYIGPSSNPYYALIKAKDNAKKLIIHQDCKMVPEYALSYHKSLQEIIFNGHEITLYAYSFAYIETLEKINFVNSKNVLFGYGSFKGASQLKDINLDINGEYFFGEGCFDKGNYILPLPRNLKFQSSFLSKNITLLFVPKEISSLDGTGAIKDIEIYYEKDLPTLEIRKGRIETIETEEDYGWNFHRSSGSFTYHETKIPAIYAHNGKSNATYEDFLKRKEQLLDK